MPDFTYRPTPPLWAVGECEDYYKGMAGKGWLLYKRGAVLDKYRRGQPQPQRYRLEIAGSSFLNGVKPLPGEQLELYEDCGWTLAAKRKEIYVFHAPEDSAVPEIYDDGAQRADMLAGLKKHYRGDAFGVAFWIAWLCLCLNIRRLGSFRTMVEADFLLAGLAAFWMLMMWRAAHGLAMMRILLRRLRQGGREPVREKRFAVHRLVTGALGAALLLCLTGAGAEALLRRSLPLPETGENVPYLLGEEVFTARRNTETGPVSFGVKTNNVKYTPTLLSPAQYHTHEQLLSDDGGQGFLYQHIYITWNGFLAEKLAGALAAYPVLSPPEDFRQIDFEGLDLALLSENGLELIAVRGGTAVYAICAGFGDDAAESLLAAYAEKLQPRG